MLQFYDKALATSVLALAALVSPSFADATNATCNPADGFPATAKGFHAEASACTAASEAPELGAMATGVSILIDRAREKRGLDPLPSASVLDQAAMVHAIEIAATGDASHRGSDGRTHLDRIRTLDRTGLYGAVGANIVVVPAGTDAIDAYNALMADPVNAENLTRGVFTHGGLAVTTDGDTLYLVQVFGQLDGELETPLPIALPEAADLSAKLADDGATILRWRLEDPSGLRIRSGSGDGFRRTGAEQGELSLVLEVDRGGVIQTLRGPMLTAGPAAGF